MSIIGENLVSADETITTKMAQDRFRPQKEEQAPDRSPNGQLLQKSRDPSKQRP